jgi:hypothetical protein
MEADSWQVCFFQQRFAPIYHFVWIQRCSQRRTEDEATLLSRLTGLQFCLCLAKAVLLEQVDYQGSERDAPPGFVLTHLGPSLAHQSS